MDFGVLIEPLYPASELVRIARTAEELSFASFWYPDEKFYRDPYVGLTLVAQHTRRMQIGVCVTEPYSRHPILTAMAIGSLAESAPGRTWLGMGAGGRGFNAMGITRDRPAIAIREAVEVIRKLLAGESVDYHGKVIQLNERKLDFLPPQGIKVMIATGYGHRVQELAGEIGDAAMLANYATPQTMQPGLGRVELGAKKAGRTLKDLRLISRLDVAVHESGEVARTAVAPIILSAMRASYPSLEYLADLPEFELPSKLLSVMGRKDYKTRSYYADAQRSAALIPPALTEHMSIAGTPEQVRSRIEAICAMQVFDEITLRPVPCGGQGMQDCLQEIHSVIT